MVANYLMYKFLQIQKVVIMINCVGTSVNQGGTVMYCGGERGQSVPLRAHPRPSAVHARASG